MGDPEIVSRIAQYEMAFKHADVGPGADRYLEGAQSRFSTCTDRMSTQPGTFAYNCLLARAAGGAGRALHAGLPPRLGSSRQPAGEHPQPVPRSPTAGKRRVDLGPRSGGGCSTTRWLSGGASSAGPVYSQGTLTKDNYGRDHHPRNFTMWMAGGGVKKGLVYGETGRLQLQRRRQAGAHPRPERHDPALPAGSTTSS